MYDILLLLGLAIAALAFVLVPIFILIKSIAAYRIARRDIWPHVMKAVVALVVWTALTTAMFFALFTHVFGMAHRIDRDAPPHATAALPLLAIELVYALAGCGLVYWTTRRAGDDDATSLGVARPDDSTSPNNSTSQTNATIQE